MLKVRAESTRALEHLIWEIRALESVERTKTVVVLGTEFEGRPISPIAPGAEVPPAEQRSAGGG